MHESEDGKAGSEKSSAAQEDEGDQNSARPPNLERSLAHNRHDDGFLTAIHLIGQGHVYWGLSSILFMFLPFAMKVGMLISESMGEHGKSWGETLCQRPPQHPLCQPTEANPDGHQVGHAGSKKDVEHKRD